MIEQSATTFPSGASIDLPADQFWPLRVTVERDGDPVSFKLMLAYHWQFSTLVKGGVLPA